MANAIRALSMDAVQAANSGHPGMPMGMADVATVLFSQFLKFDPAAPRLGRPRPVRAVGRAWLDADLFAAASHRLCQPTMDDIRNFRQLHSPCAGHPENFLSPKASNARRARWGRDLPWRSAWRLPNGTSTPSWRDLVDHRTWVIAGDGCLMEGINHEAIGLAGHLGLAA
jgi:transketolase